MEQGNLQCFETRTEKMVDGSGKFEREFERTEVRQSSFTEMEESWKFQSSDESSSRTSGMKSIV